MSRSVSLRLFRYRSKQQRNAHSPSIGSTRNFPIFCWLSCGASRNLRPQPSTRSPTSSHWTSASQWDGCRRSPGVKAVDIRPQRRARGSLAYFPDMRFNQERGRHVLLLFFAQHDDREKGASSVQGPQPLGHAPQMPEVWRNVDHHRRLHQEYVNCRAGRRKESHDDANKLRPHLSMRA